MGGSKHTGVSVRYPAIALIRDVISSFGWRLALFFAGAVLFGLAGLLPPEFLIYFTRGTQKISDQSADQFLLRLGIFGAIVAVVLLLTTLGNILMQEWLRLTIESYLRKRILRSLHFTPPSIIEGAQRGEWLARMTGDLRGVEEFLSDSIPRYIRQIAILLGATILFVVHSGTLAIVPLMSAVVLALVNFGIQKRLAPRLSELRDLHGVVLQMLVESFEGMRTIRSHSVERFVQRHFDNKLKTITTQGMLAVRYLGVLMGSNEFVVQAMVTLSLTAVSFSLMKNGMGLEEALIYPFFIGMFYGAAQSLANWSCDWNRYLIEGGRLARIMYAEPIPNKPIIKDLSDFDFSRVNALELRQLTVGFEGAKPLGPIDLRLKRGEMRVLMGTLGCGKSTLLEVLAGLRPALSGSSQLTDVTGRTLWKTGFVRELILPSGLCSFVEQHPYIFDGSLRENLTFGDESLNQDGLLWECLERASLTAFAKKAGGLDFWLGDRGENLSEGERYRVAVCRALLLKRPFLLIDEPFAALDKLSIASIANTLNTEKSETGILLVTHCLPESLRADGVHSFETCSFVEVKKEEPEFFQFPKVEPGERAVP